MDSEQVRREWSHALGLGRPDFVRPVYWQTPRPERPDRNLPPAELNRLHFHFLDFSGADEVGVIPATPAPAASRAPPPAPGSAGGGVAATAPGHIARDRGRRGTRRSRLGVVAVGVAAALALVVGGSMLGGGDEQGDLASVDSPTTADAPPSGTQDSSDSPPESFGDDAQLDRLTDACTAGELGACDVLWDEAPSGSEYEAFAARCGDASAFEFGGTCEAEFDAALDGQAVACVDGDLASCDVLSAGAAPNSLYGRIGSFCGGHSEAPLPGRCLVTIGTSSAPVQSPG